MPCHDIGPECFPTLQQFDQRTAMLCGLVRAIEKISTLETILNVVDWREAGVTHDDFDLWWAEHQREDAARRTAEHRAKLVAAQRTAALAKLSAEEKRGLP